MTIRSLVAVTGAYFLAPWASLPADAAGGGNGTPVATFDGPGGGSYLKVSARRGSACRRDCRDRKTT